MERALKTNASINELALYVKAFLMAFVDGQNSVIMQTDWRIRLDMSQQQQPLHIIVEVEAVRVGPASIPLRVWIVPFLFFTIQELLEYLSSRGVAVEWREANQEVIVAIRVVGHQMTMFHCNLMDQIRPIIDVVALDDVSVLGLVFRNVKHD